MTFQKEATPTKQQNPVQRPSETPVPAPGFPFWLPDASRWGPAFSRVESYAVDVIRRHWVLPLLLLVALAVRWPTWGSLHYYGDDAEYATVARYLAADPLYLAYPQMEQFAATPFVSQPPLVLYLFALGARLTGDIETGAVLVSVTLGVLTCGLLYALGALLQRRAVGIVAASFLAFAPMHVDFSRRAFLDVGLTFFMTLAVLLFVWWSRQPSNGRAILVGVASAATIMSKLPGVLIVAVLGLPFLWLLNRQVWRHLRRQPRVPGEIMNLMRHGGLAALPALLVGLAYVGLLAYLDGLANLKQKLGWQAERIGGPDANAPWHYYLTSPDIGVSDQFGILFFLLAVAGALRINRISKQWGDGRVGMLAVLAWPLVVSVFFILGSRKQWFYIMPVVPAVAFLGAWMLVEVATWVRNWPDEMTSTRARSVYRFASIAIVLVFLAVPVSQSTADRPSERPFGYGVKEAAFLIDSLDPDAAQVGTLLGRFTLHFYNEHPTYHWHNDHGFIEDEIEAGRLRFIVLDTYLNLTYETEWMEELVVAYEARLIAEYQPASPSGRVLVYEIPRPAAS